MAVRMFLSQIVFEFVEKKNNALILKVSKISARLITCRSFFLAGSDVSL